ncbi:MAG: hypothetical protein PHN75_21025, partial [Syntrophales bacterium]|nr:hypothetical protein [Syntrophales bacterium]
SGYRRGLCVFLQHRPPLRGNGGGSCGNLASLEEDDHSSRDVERGRYNGNGNGCSLKFPIYITLKGVEG